MTLDTLPECTARIYINPTWSTARNADMVHQTKTAHGVDAFLFWSEKDHCTFSHPTRDGAMMLEQKFKIEGGRGPTQDELAARGIGAGKAIPRVFVTVSGGLVNEVFSPETCLNVTIIDYDVDVLDHPFDVMFRGQTGRACVNNYHEEALSADMPPVIAKASISPDALA